MLVYVALALAVAFVLRRGDGPGVLGGIVLGVTVISFVRARDATLPRPLDTYDDPDRPRTGWLSRSGTGTRSGCWRRSALSWRSASWRTHAARFARARAAAVTPDHGDDAVLHVLARCVGRALVGFVVAVAMDPRRLRLLWIDLRRAAIRPGVHRVRVSPRCAHDRGRAGGCSGARGASRCGGRLRCDRASWALAWAARAVSRRVDVSAAAPQGASTSRWPVLAVACVGSVL